MRYGRLLKLAAVAAAANPLALLNEQRAANGIPAGITENPEWSAGCAAHMDYLRLNGFRGDWHTEEPGRPGYSAAGAAAAKGAVLSDGPAAGVETDWEQWPYHFAQLLAPKLSVSGFADGCIVTWPGYQRPEPPELRTYTYPGDGAQDTTSPYLYVLGYGAGTRTASLSGVALSGPEGPLSVRVVDNHTPGAEGLLPPGGILFPGAPLEQGALYTAQATFTSDAGPRTTHRWSFRAGAVTDPGDAEAFGELLPAAVAPAASAPAPRTPKVTLRLSRGYATVSARGLTVGRRARVKVQRLDCRCRARTRTVRLTATPRRIPTGASRARVTVTLGAFWAGEIPFRGLTLTRTLS